MSQQRLAQLLAHYGNGTDRIRYWQLVRMVSSTLAELPTEAPAAAAAAADPTLYSTVGLISAAVLGGTRQLRAAFDVMDRDHDKLLSPAELCTVSTLRR